MASKASRAKARLAAFSSFHVKPEAALPVHESSLSATASTMSLVSQPSRFLALPSTAPVREYICLFTHDLKRKQKRWQDGRLKFHTFNKRVMVYDERGSFIGDMHWNEDFDFDEGEEFNLERGAVIVQVAECLGSKDQDLTELLDKRAREIDQRHARASSSAVSSSLHNARASLTSRPPLQQQQMHGQFRQKHLVDLINTPRGPPGRAVIPKTSPYEERMAAQGSSPLGENQRPAKRRKRDASPPSKAGYAQNLFGTALTLSSWAASAPVRSQPVTTPINQKIRLTPPFRDSEHFHSRSTAVVDLTDDSQATRSACRVSDKTPKSMPQTEGTLLPRLSRTKRKVVERSMPKAQSERISPGVEETPNSSNGRPQSNAGLTRQVAPRTAIRKIQESPNAAASPLQEHPQVDRRQARQRAALRSIGEKDVIASESIQDSMVDKASHTPLKASPTTSIEPDMSEEPKATLRIKASQRRRLLMTSSKAVPKRPSSFRSEPASPSEKVGVIADNAPSSIPKVSGSVSDDYEECKYAVSRTIKHPKKTSMGTRGETDRSDKPEQPVKDQGQQFESTHSADVNSDEPLRQTKAPEKQKERPEPDKCRDGEDPSSHPGPRLASFGRRSVKSKEIIGSFGSRPSRLSRETCRPASYNPEESVRVADELMTSAPVRDENDSAMLDAKGQDAAKKGAPDQNIPRPRTSEDRASKQKAPKSAKAGRLVNPALGGRKADKKSDAAGTFPRCVLPATSTLASAQSASVTDSHPAMKTSSEGAEDSIDREQQSAGAIGGPWSKEAFDLLGFIRPV